MKRHIILLTGLIALLLTPLVAQTISKVRIEGLQNVREKTVRSEIKAKEGREYSPETVTSDIKNILGLGYFENVEVRVDTTTWTLTYIVDEKPYVKSINFKGNKKFSAGKLRDEIPLKEREYYDYLKLSESKDRILELYNEKGYADARVEVYPTVDETTNQMTVTFLINEGKRILIGDVILEGVEEFKPKKIRKLMKTRKKKVYSDETFRADLRKIEEFYKNRGYINMRIGEPQIVYNEERTKMFITIPVEEGSKYRVGDVTFSGTTIFNDYQLAKDLPLKPGQVYSEERLQEARQMLLEMYSDRGYLHAQIAPEFDADPETGIIDVTFDVSEGDIIYLGNLYIDGLTYTKEYVIRREVTLEPREVFSASKVRRSIEKIYNLGFIDAVEPEIQPTPNPSVMDLVMNVTEGKPGILSAGAGYSSVDQFVGSLQVQHINLFGRAQRLNLLWEFGARRQNYEIDWTEPWFMGEPVSLGLGVFNTERWQDYQTITNAYREARSGGTIRVGPRLNDNLSLLFTYSYEDIEVFDLDPRIRKANLGVNADPDPNNDVAGLLPDDQLLSPSKDITSSLTTQVAWDTRDNIFDATRGNRQSLSVQVAGGPFGGEVNFVKSIAKSSWHIPTFWKFVLSINGTVGVVHNFNPTSEVPDVPIYDRFFVGGADTVRGYDYRSEIGPVNGGRIMSVLNIEYKFPIVQERRRSILQGAFFFDAGGAWLREEDITWRFGESENDLKAGIGFGLRFTTPVFPLRLDWGYGLNHRPGEELSQFYFTIGSLF